MFGCRFRNRQNLKVRHKSNVRPSYWVLLWERENVIKSRFPPVHAEGSEPLLLYSKPPVYIATECAQPWLILIRKELSGPSEKRHIFCTRCPPTEVTLNNLPSQFYFNLQWHDPVRGLPITSRVKDYGSKNWNTQYKYWSRTILFCLDAGRSWDRPSRHRFFLVSLCTRANAGMVPDTSKLPLHASHVALHT